MNPKISVVIPTCNRPDRVKNAIKSVLKQTFPDFEIIVVDDGMKERAEMAVCGFKDRRIRYIKHETNKGGGAARNTGIKNAKADLIAFLDDDDEWHSEKLEKQYKIIKKYWHEIGFAFCAIELYYETENRISRQTFKKTGIHNFYKDLLAHKLRTLTSSLLIKKSILDNIGGFDESFPSSQEWDLMIRVARENRGYCLNEVLVKMHFLQGDHIGGNLGKRIKGRELLLKKYFKELEKRPRVLSWHYWQLGLFCRDNNEFKKARPYFFKAWCLEKSNIRILAHYLCTFCPKIWEKLKNTKNNFI